MKLRFRHKLTIFCLLFLAALIGQRSWQASAAEFEDDSVILYLGEEEKAEKVLKVTGTESGSVLRFASADKSVVTVGSKSGKITAAAAGKTTVTCTITAADGTKSTCKATVRVMDNIKKLNLKLADTSIRSNALKKHTSYELSLDVTTIAGTNENTGNYIFYEVLNSSGKTTKYAGVEDGSFLAKRSGTYYVRVYAFQSSGLYKKWLTDREQYRDYVLAEDELTLTVTLKNFETVSKKVKGWKLVLPEEYEVTSNESSGLVTFSIHAENKEELSHASNIQIRIDTLEEQQDFSELKYSINTAYTKSLIAESWKAAYRAKTVYVQKLKREELTINGSSVMKISYHIILKNMTIDMENAADIKISRLEFFNTVYTWYDGPDHITINVTDAYEGIQPNITEAAEKLAENFTH